ncbi:MAG TPA: ABC transporter permease [Terriglobales bacterium]|nr:ABC transporter permease [Terriglobales bacterium]
MELVRDLRYAWRQLRRNPGVALVAVAALTLGIGANTALFSLVNGVLLRPLPYSQADRVALVRPISLDGFFDCRANNQAFSSVGLLKDQNFDINGIPEPYRAVGVFATSGVFSTLAVRPLLGRALQPDDDSPSSTSTAVVSEALWRQVLGARGDIVGLHVSLNQRPVTIVGVMSEVFQFPSPDTGIWVSLQPRPPASALAPLEYTAIARLRPGVSWPQAQADTNRTLRSRTPLASLRDALLGDVQRPLWILMGAVLVLLMIAVANVSSLMLARAQVPAPEMATRASLGATRARLIQQSLVESCLLSLLGAAGGILLATAALRWLKSVNFGDLPRLPDIHLDATVLAFTVIVALVAGLASGLAPALRLSQFHLVSKAKNAQRLSHWLSAMEMAMTVVLLIAAGLLARNYARLLHRDTGFQTAADQILLTHISLRGHAQDPTYFDRLLPAIAAFPGVEQAAITTAVPDDWWGSETYSLRGRPWSPGAFPAAVIATVSPDYFRLTGVALLAGRNFDDRDTAATEPVVIISQALAQHRFGNLSPLGQYLRPGDPATTQGPDHRIIGVVANVTYKDAHTAPNAAEAVYTPYRQSSTTVAMILTHTRRPPAQVGDWIRKQATALYPNAIVRPTERLSATYVDAFSSARFQTDMILIFAVLALAVALAGIYCVLSYAVARREREIGIRMALGATRQRLVAGIVSQGMSCGAAGAAAGVVVALMLSSLLSAMVSDVSVTDPLIFVLAPVLLLAAAAVASYLPARRAANLDPLVALRHE